AAAAPRSAAAPPRRATTPVAQAPGRLVALVMPWARLVRVENLDTGEALAREIETPARLELPAGRYRLTFDSPHASEPLETEVTIRPGATRYVRRTMPGFDPAALADELAAIDTRAEKTP
ncbi:MAG: hypothetical protein D6738_08375, partial [Acidobacteria bacterium]